VAYFSDNRLPNAVRTQPKPALPVCSSDTGIWRHNHFSAHVCQAGLSGMFVRLPTRGGGRPLMPCGRMHAQRAPRACHRVPCAALAYIYRTSAPWRVPPPPCARHGISCRCPDQLSLRFSACAGQRSPPHMPRCDLPVSNESLLLYAAAFSGVVQVHQAQTPP